MGVPLLVAGAGISAYSQIQSANDRADAARRDAVDKGMQATEVEAAGQREDMLLHQKGMQTEGAQAASYAQNGFDTSGASLMSLESTAAQVASESNALKRNYAFRAAQLRRGQASENTIADQTESAGYLGAFGTLLGGAGSAVAANNKKGFSSDQNDGNTVSIGGK